MNKLRQEWLGNVRGDILAGIVVFMALIPEVMGFSIVAGVDPMVGIYASFCMTLITAIFGGRPGLISAAAGATALVLASLVRDYGIEYMLAATILTGFLQVVFGFLKIGNLLKFIPKPVMIGFVNALGIMMLQSQLAHFQGPISLLVLAGLGISIIYLLPRVTTKIPSPIVAIATITVIVFIFDIDIQTLGDMGTITSTLPSFLIPNIPFNLETLAIIFPYALSVSIVGIVESLLTAQLVDEMTQTDSDKNQECVGQGLANIVSGFFGGIAGCGMIGQTMVNMNYGGRGRLSSVVAGSLMLGSALLFSDFLVQIPIVALAAVMVVVSITTFNWESLRRLKHVPVSDTMTMLVTVIVVLGTHNLAYGVVAGCILSALFFVSKLSKINVTFTDGEMPTFVVSGQLFFASTTTFMQALNQDIQTKEVCIDFSNVRIIDDSAVDAIDKVVIRYHQKGIKTTLVGLSDECQQLLDKLAVHNKPGGLTKTLSH